MEPALNCSYGTRVTKMNSWHSKLLLSQLMCVVLVFFYCSWSRALPFNHKIVLSKFSWCAFSVWYHKSCFIRTHTIVDDGGKTSYRTTSARVCVNRLQIRFSEQWCSSWGEPWWSESICRTKWPVFCRNIGSNRCQCRRSVQHGDARGLPSNSNAASICW